MSKATASPESAAPCTRQPWDWRLLEFLMSLFLTQREPPPPSIIRLGLVAGALEGVIVGIIHGGVFFSAVFLGAVIGLVTTVIAWRVRRRTRALFFSLLSGVAIEALGGWLIAINGAFGPQFPIWDLALLVVSTLPLMLALLPCTVVLLWISYREAVSAFYGIVVGAIVGSAILAVAGAVFAANEFGGVMAIVLGCLFGGLGGFLNGAVIGTFIGALVGALVKVNRQTFLPTYGGIAGALGFGLLGWFVGSVIGIGFMRVLGFLCIPTGIGCGALIGIRLGYLATTRLFPRMRCGDGQNPRNTAVLDLSDPQTLADTTAMRSVLYLMFLLAIRDRVGEIGLESGESQIQVTSQPPCTELHSLLEAPSELWPQLKADLTEVAAISSSDSCAKNGHWEEKLRLHIRHKEIDVQLLFEPSSERERVTMHFRQDTGAAEEASRIADKLRFIWCIRCWFFPHGWPPPGFEAIFGRLRERLRSIAAIL